MSDCCEVIVEPIINNVVVEPTINDVIISSVGAKGEKGDTGAAIEAFETVSKNLESAPYTLSYTTGTLTSIVYTVAAGTITKTLGYTGDKLTTIILSGDTPVGIDLTKTLSYTGDDLTGIVYS